MEIGRCRSDAVRRISDAGGDADRVYRRGNLGQRILTGNREHGGRRALAQAQARRWQPGRHAVGHRRAGRTKCSLEVGRQAGGAREAARDVVADMRDHQQRLRREQGVERGNAVRLCRRYAEAAADIVERRLIRPADPGLNGVECRDQKVSGGSFGRVLRLAMPIRPARGARPPLPARPAMRAAR